jgi:hypothetical protein
MSYDLEACAKKLEAAGLVVKTGEPILLRGGQGGEHWIRPARIRGGLYGVLFFD